MPELLPKVSIIIDNYNYGRFLPEAIDSALSQTYPNCEVIVVDDGSTDGSREILDQYKNRAQIILKPNGGQPSAFNAGFAAASGAFISFLDSDDILFPAAIAESVAAWRKDAAKVQFPLELIDPKGQRTGLLMPRAKLASGNVLPSYLKTGRYITSPTSGNLFPRSFLAEIFPIPEQEWSGTGDGYINTAAPFFGSIVSIDSPLAFYRSHGASMTSVCSEGSVNLSQMEKLIRHASTERNLLLQFARERGLPISQEVVVSHWLHLKLRLSFDKLREYSSGARGKHLLKNGLKMISSLLTSSDLSLWRKLQNLIWTLCVVLLPRPLALRVIVYAFDPAPKTGLALLLRRA